MRADTGGANRTSADRSRSQAPRTRCDTRLGLVSPIEAVSGLQAVLSREAAQQEPGWLVREYPNLPSDSRGGRHLKHNVGAHAGPDQNPNPVIDSANAKSIGPRRTGPCILLNPIRIEV